MKRAFQLGLVVLLALYSLAMVPGDHHSFLDGPNLLFHEAGHVIFSFDGRVLGALGGTLGQLMFPLLALAGFIRQKEPFAACIMGWWLGQNCLGIGWYMSDARIQQLELVGGGEHDWTFLFQTWGVLGYDQVIGGNVIKAGFAIMLTALIGAALVALGNSDTTEQNGRGESHAKAPKR